MIPPVLDIHPHVISPDTSAYPRAPLGGTPSGWSQDRPVTFEQLLNAMDAAGVSKAAIVQASTCYGYDNSYVADAIAAHPDRFTGVMSVDVMDEGAPDRIDHWHRRGFTGLRLFTWGSTLMSQSNWLDDPRTFPAWEKARELRMPVCVQMQLAGLPMLRNVLERFSDVPVIIDHLMRPPIADGPPYAQASGLFELARYENIYLKLTINLMRDSKLGKATSESFFGQVAKAFGATRIAWGSNFPAATGTLKEIVDESLKILEWMPDGDREAIFSGTAKALYPTLRD